MIKKISSILKQFGFNPKQTIQSLRGIVPYLQNYSIIKKEIKKFDTGFAIKSFAPNLFDRYDTAGSTPLHYFYQDLFVAQKIFKDNPQKHIDIGSRIDGFVAHLASFRNVEVFDIRIFEEKIPNVEFVQADMMSDNFNLTDYCDSISCLHAIEHFGLGRYGDPVDINGHLKGLNNIYKILRKNGKFYFATPIGQQRIEFDAHRVFSVKYLLDYFNPKYQLLSFSYIDDENRFFLEVEINESKVQNNFGCNYGCGIFEMIKI